MTSRRLLTKEARILLGAADGIEERGLCKGVYQGTDGSMCALGAIWKAGRSAGDGGSEAAAKFARFIGYSLVSMWNDAPERTQEEVVCALRECALS